MDWNKNGHTIGSRIRKVREAKGLTQLELAKLLYVKRETVNQWENDSRQIKAENIAAIAEKLETSCDYLLGRTESPSVDLDARIACDYTGLSDKAVRWLKSCKDDHQPLLVDILNSILENDGLAFLLLQTMYSYATSKFKRVTIHDDLLGIETEKSSGASREILKFEAQETFSIVLRALYRKYSNN